MSSQIKRTKRTQSDLHADSATVRYELEQLIKLALAFPTIAERVTKNAYVESFAIHCRALILFLFGHRGEIIGAGEPEKFRARPNDVIAYDFHQQWDVDCPASTEIMRDAKVRADKHVAHITIERRGVNQRNSDKEESVWDIGRATTSICKIFDCFLSNAPSENFDPAELARMRKLIAEWDSKMKQADYVASPATKLHGKPAPSPVPQQFNLHGKTQ